MGAESTPTFWHLDGSDMDNDFLFLFHCTRGEWGREERRLKQ
jgi:hypothetical protein